MQISLSSFSVENEMVKDVYKASLGPEDKDPYSDGLLGKCLTLINRLRKTPAADVFDVEGITEKCFETADDLEEELETLRSAPEKNLILRIKLCTYDEGLLCSQTTFLLMELWIPEA